VETPSVRLLPYAVAAGAHNMAADEALLQAALAGTPSLRFYGWSGPTVSLGYFQPEALRRADPRLAQLPYVRRPSGGATLVHHHEVTYALALPPGSPWQSGPTAQVWLKRMHDIIAAALGDLGVPARPHVPGPQDEFPGCLCFRHLAAGDLLIGGLKVTGSAQRRHRGALLQHGAILLAQSPFTPELPGVLELTGHRLVTEEVCAAVRERFQRETGWGLAAGELTPGERQAIADLEAGKYTSEAWNRKR
jgi:lipoate-protein ligase A